MSEEKGYKSWMTEGEDGWIREERRGVMPGRGRGRGGCRGAAGARMCAKRDAADKRAQSRKRVKAILQGRHPQKSWAGESVGRSAASGPGKTEEKRGD